MLGSEPLDALSFSRQFARVFGAALDDGWIQAKEFRDQGVVGSRNNHARMVRLLNDCIEALGEEYLNEYRIANPTAPGQVGRQGMFRADAVSLADRQSGVFSGVFQYRSLNAGRRVTVRETRQLIALRDCSTRMLIFPITSTEAGLTSGRMNGKTWLLDEVKAAIMRSESRAFASGPIGVLTIEDEPTGSLIPPGVPFHLRLRNFAGGSHENTTDLERKAVG